MQQAIAFSRRVEPSASPQGTSVREIALAFVLALGLLYTALPGGDDESYVVSLTDLDTAIVLSLRNGTVVAPDLAVGPDPAETAPASEPARPAAALLPTMDFLRGIDVGQVVVNAKATIIGIASTYNPFGRGADAAVAPTASGEAYDPESWTAAIQIDLRQQFGGVRFGRLYRPAFALVERGDKRAIVRINDVGPLRPGRVIDLNERTMRYFDPSLRLGLVHDMKITLLPGDNWTPGPVGEEMRIGLASAE